MNKLPILQTKRLILRPFNINDSKQVKLLAGNKEIAKTTSNIPHPYEVEMAINWINKHEENYNKNETLCLAIVRKKDEYLIGAISLVNIVKQHNRAELGYWIGKDYWNNGYCTEAAEAIIKYGFINMNLNKIYSTYFKGNIASKKVMLKIGMKKEGVLREHVKKWNKYIDLVEYCILRYDYLAKKDNGV